MRLKNLLTKIFLLILANGLLGGWQQGKTHYPRLTFENQDIPIIRSHYEAALNGVEPYKTLWDRIQKSNAKTPKIGNKEWGQQNANAGIAKAKALIYLLTGDRRQADDVRDILSGVYTGEEIPKYGVKSITLKLTPYKNLKSAVMQSIHKAQSLTQHCQAYDILKGAGYPFGASESGIRKNLATLAERIYDISNWISSGSKTLDLIRQDVEEQNNFQLKMMSALGLAAICLNDHPNAEKWANRAMTKFWQVFIAQTTPQGGYGEGPFYFLYSGLNFLPFFRAYNLFMDGRSVTFDGHAIPNFLSNDRVAMVFDWNIKIRMPNGDRPGFDDGYYTAFPSGLLVSEPEMSGHATDHHPNADLAVYAWDWLNTEQMTGGYENRYLSAFANLDLTVDLFCVFDADVHPHEPQVSATQFFPEAGSAVFRSDWGRDAIYMHVLGEAGTVRTIGGVHEHPDAGSFVIFAHREMLALDAGYPGFPQHDLVNKAQNHSVITVDGFGPDSDARLGEFFRTEMFDFASVTMSYGGASITRNILFVNKSYFIIVDQLESSSQREYALFIHGNAGGTIPNTSFSKTANGGVWNRSRARLEAVVYSDKDTPVYEYGDDFHSIMFAGDNQLPKHGVLKVRQSAKKLRFITLLFPLSAKNQSPRIKPVNASSGFALKIYEPSAVPAYFIAGGDEAVTTVTTDIMGVAELTTDAVITFIRLSPDAEIPEHFYAKNMKTVEYNRKKLITTKSNSNIALVRIPGKNELIGKIQAEMNSTFQLVLTANDAEVSGVKRFSFDKRSRLLKMEVESSTQFRILLK
ncbi:hypothetical protein GF337_05455 [candidate division KSB1 bacterium]|nr:hypothetical protein [candidate division KSB1 bacterium]